MKSISEYRRFLKAEHWDEWDKMETDRKKKKPPPLPQAPCPKEIPLVELIMPENLTLGEMS